MIPLQRFLQLSNDEIADIVRSNGTKVCVFPFNGTRRWFLLEDQSVDLQAYTDASAAGSIRIWKMLFDHGIETIVTPIFGKDLLKRGDEYVDIIGENLKMLAYHTAFRSFYDMYSVRVHFYGDYQQELKGKHNDILDAFHQATVSTALHKKHKLLFGVFADDATQAIARLAIEYHSENNKTPSREDLVKLYYGESVEQASFFIGFERFQVYDYPMLATGEEDLYFTFAPSFYMSETLLRKILYDHIYLRHTPEPDYSKMTENDIATMREYYHQRRDDALGIGRMSGGIWYADK